MLQIQDGCFGYRKGEQILSDINLRLPAGQLLAILGPNGVGKTTLLRCMLGLQHWSSGRTLLDGRDLSGLGSAELWRQVAYVPQARNAGAISLLGLDMVLIGRSAHLPMLAQPSAQDREAALQVMEGIGIGHLAPVPCGQMSGGQFQMVLIARALAAEPKVMVLDEPETGLDFRNQLIALELLEELVTERKLGVVMNTHYPAHALRIADSALLLKRGSTPLFGPVDQAITEDTLREAFGVEVNLSRIETGQRIHQAVTPLHLV